MENQLELYGGIRQTMAKFEKELPAVAAARAALRDEVYKDGALSHKVKRLIAMGIAIRAGCTGCTIAQTRQAVELGATKEEVLEAISVAMTIGGTIAGADSYRAVKVLEEMGKL